MRNWRGVGECTVEFAPSGVTVVEGPNEAGKSSLVEALDLLFDELDSSGKSRVRAAKPVHADAGAEVEVDIESGAYAFTYSKRFHKKAQTTLTVRAPRAESLTGRDAHERADAILRETLDVSLWKALRVSQGMGLEQADLSGKPWLTAALDRAAGGAAPTGGREEALFDAVRGERDRWWSDRGPRKEIGEADQRRADAAAVVAQLKGELAMLDQDVDRAATLAKEVARLEVSCIELERRASEHAAAAVALTKLRAARDDAERRFAQAETAHARAQAARDERVALAGDLAAAEAATMEAGHALTAGSPGMEGARAALAEAEKDLALAEAGAEAARREVELRERDFEYRHDELELQQMSERRARLAVADREAASAEETVALILVDDPTLAKLRALNEEVVKARVRLEAASATVSVEALRSCSPEIDGTLTPLVRGETRDVRVLGTWRIEVPGVLRMDVRSGAGTDAPRTDFESRRRGLDAALAAARVATLDEAESANVRLREARRTLADRDRVAKDDLRDLTREGLARKIDNLQPRVSGYCAQRPASPELPADFETAQDLRRKAKDDATAADAASTAARAHRDAVKLRADTTVAMSNEGEARLRLLREQAAVIRRRLDTQRAGTPDEALDSALGHAETQMAAVARESQVAREALDAAQPDVVDGLARSGRIAADKAREDRHGLTSNLAALRATLQLRGEDGLSERLGAAEAALEVANGEAARKHAQADAAKALFDAMAAERDAERARYVAPFRAKVEALGRTVFGADFAVDIDDDLRITSRTLAGRTVEFDSLSGGAKEQIGVISRIACAILAADEGGVPVILDDAFGWSDPDRLERMGALLAVVGRTCQVILLTCDPIRHRHIPGGRVVRIA